MIGTNTNDLNQLVQNQGFADLHEFAKIKLTAWIGFQLKHYEMSSPQHSAQFEQMLAGINQADNKKNIEKAVEKMGFSMEAYIKKELLSFWKEKTAHLETLASYYRYKYGTGSFAEASEKFNDYPYNIIEKEDDLWNWENAADFLEGYAQLIKEVENAG